MPDVAFYGLWCVTTATVGQKLKTVLVGFVVAVAELRNFTGAFIGTWHIWADLYWFEKCIHFSKERHRLG